MHVIAQKPEKTGSGVFVGSIIKEAAARGYKQALVAGVSAHDTRAAVDELGDVAFYPVLFDSEAIGFPVVGMSDVMPYPSTRYCDLSEAMLAVWESAFAVCLKQALQKFKPDLILSHHLWLLSAIVCRLAEEEGIPVICVCHGTDLRQLELCPGHLERIKNSLNSAAQVLALTEHQASRIHKTFRIEKKRIAVIGTAYNASLFKPALAETNSQNSTRKDASLIYAGKLSCSKGVLSLLHAYERIPKELQPILYLVGEGTGQEKEQIEKVANECKNKVVMTGALRQQELAKLLHSAKVFVLPSFYEGLPLVVLEAMASGLQVVTTELPGLRQWLGEELNRLGVIEYVQLPAMETIDKPYASELPAFEQRLADAMLTLLKRSFAQEQQNQEKVSLLIKQHTWSGMLDRLEKIFEQSIKSSNKE